VVLVSELSQRTTRETGPALYRLRPARVCLRAYARRLLPERRPRDGPRNTAQRVDGIRVAQCAGGLSLSGLSTRRITRVRHARNLLFVEFRPETDCPRLSAPRICGAPVPQQDVHHLRQSRPQPARSSFARPRSSAGCWTHSRESCRALLFHLGCKSSFTRNACKSVDSNRDRRTSRRHTGGVRSREPGLRN
jgi:hypothetical protein